MSTRNTPPSIDPKNNIPSLLPAIDARFKTCPNSKRRHVPRSVQQRLIQTVGSAFYALYLQEHVQQRLLHQRWIIVRTKTSIALQMTICYSSLRAFRTSQPLIHLPPRPTQTACLPATFATLRATTASSSFHFHPHQPPARGREFNQHHLVLEIFQLSVLGTVRFAKQLPPVGGVKRERGKETRQLARDPQAERAATTAPPSLFSICAYGGIARN